MNKSHTPTYSPDYAKISAALFSIVIIAAIVTHWVACVKAGAWTLLIAGSIIFPVGIAHGVASWLGYVWT
jgi:hypothetical protein